MGKQQVWLKLKASSQKAKYKTLRICFDQYNAVNLAQILRIELNPKFLKVETSPTAEIVSLLEQNTIGTPKKSMVYQHATMRSKLFGIQNPHFVNLKKGTSLIGTCCFCERESLDPNKGKIDSFYIRYFSFKPSFRAWGKSRKSNSTSLLRTEIHDILKGTNFGKAEGSRFYHYAYVDPNNERSKKLCMEFGFTSLRYFKPIMFGRIFPNQHKRIEQLPPAEYDHMRILLRDFYSSYSMFNYENLLGKYSYYVLRQEGKIVAGLQAAVDNWKILSMPGKFGVTAIAAISRIPILNRILNQDFRFLAIEGIYHAPGHELSISKLIEGLLSHHRLKCALMFLDEKSTLFNSIKSLNLGIAGKLSKPISGEVIGRFNGMSEEEMLCIKNSPAYISAIDIT